MYKTIIAALAVLFLGMVITSCSNKNEGQEMEGYNPTEQEFIKFAGEFNEKAKTTYRNMAEGYFKASIENTEELWKQFAEYDKQLNALYSDTAVFAKLKEFKESGEIKNELLARQLEVMHSELLAKQIPVERLNALTEAQTAIEGKYSKFRAEVDGNKLSDNEVEDVLKTSKDSEHLKKTWLAHKEIGPLVKDDIINLVKMRNEAARELGFKNYHAMSLALSEQDPEMIENLFDELDELTRGAFAEVKAEMDTKLAAQYGIKPEELMPWHYQNRYFQEAPAIYDADLDAVYTKYDKEGIVKLTEDYFAGLNLPIDKLVAKSDLFEKEGKNQHAYCINIDRDSNDIRVLCNVVPNSRWMETMLHEYGHALYENYYPQDIPWNLKTPAHIFTTEAIAMLFGRFALNPEWMQEMTGISDEEKEEIAEAAVKTMRLQQLVFSRWAQVMYRFEKAMYENPDQDLNKLWWDIVEKYQMIKRPEGRDMPDWATKIHIATAPCYYHNYLLGELLASQLYYTINTQVLQSENPEMATYIGKPEVGNFLVEKIFRPANQHYWNDMIEQATGEKLTPKYYAKQFVN
jgi:peptidyl-dipeptidase A